MDDSNFKREFSIQERKFARHEQLRTEYHERRILTALESLCSRRAPAPNDPAGGLEEVVDRPTSA